MTKHRLVKRAPLGTLLAPLDAEKQLDAIIEQNSVDEVLEYLLRKHNAKTVHWLERQEEPPDDDGEGCDMECWNCPQKQSCVMGHTFAGGGTQ